MGFRHGGLGRGGICGTSDRCQVRVPLVAGHLFGVMSRTIAHFTTLIRSGRWVVFTCFTDQLLSAHTNLPTTIIG